MPREPSQEPHHDHGVALEPARPEVAPPPFYQVMLNVHTRGRGVCGVFTREVAESKVAQVNEFSRMNQHPLLCTMEKAG
jgi:ATP-dependent Clp protease adaptor protein ClpS